MSVSAQKSSAPALPERVARLVDRFQERRDDYLAVGYNESNTRAEFIDPLLKALGWDVENESGFSEEYKQVRREDKIPVAGKPRSPDYCLCYGGLRKILVEAKKPAVRLEENAEAALQLRRYAWNAEVPVGILTNFSEFAVYDCREQPRAAHPANRGRMCHFTFQEYGERWKWMTRHFSPDGIGTGRLGDLVDDSGAQHGAENVGDAFLKRMEKFRADLAREIALRNPKLTERELNSATQRTLDRIIFLRVCEDRGVEGFGRLRDAAAKPDVYKAMMRLFQAADRRFNSGLFYFRQERGRGKPDELTPQLRVSNRALVDIVGELYWPNSPYDFSVLSADILGQVYERFLGKEIRLTAGHQARVTEKPEVKKQGGVFYTPEWVVKHIVKRAVGDALRDKQYLQARKIRILDPACGSGSFLLGAYQFLLDWHLAEYDGNPAAHLRAGRIVKDDQGNFRLSLSERRAILMANLWGVDKDEQAVEVTKLSLMLKCLEGENTGSIGTPRTLGMRALPDLTRNIRAGNSIIAPDFYPGLAPQDDREIKRINAFEWRENFPQILDEEGGFDAVIGNPPYVRQEVLGQEFKKYAAPRYKVYHGVADLFAYFIERGLSLLKPKGRFCYIVANRWLRANYGAPLREFLRERAEIEGIVDFGELPVFRGAATFPCIVSLRRPAGQRKVTRQQFDFAAITRLDFDGLDKEIEREKRSMDSRAIHGNVWTLTGLGVLGVFEKMRKSSVPLERVYKVRRGLVIGRNDIFVVDDVTRRRLIRGNRKSADLIKPVAVGDDVRGYAPLPRGKWLICIPRGFTNEKRGKMRARAFMEAEHPALMEYLRPFEAPAKKRVDKGDYWWELRACNYYDEMAGAKIIYPDISKDRRATLDERGVYLTNTAYFIPSSDLVLLAILNSRLAFHWMKRHASVLGNADAGGRIRWFRQNVSQFPIPSARPGDKADAKTRKEIAVLARQMLDTRAQIAATPDSSVCENLESVFKKMDREVDEKVFALYNLTNAERRIITS